MLIVQPPIKELSMTTEEEGTTWEIDSEDDWVRLWMLDAEIFAEWQLFAILERGKGGLMAYRDPRREEDWSLSPIV